jgi:hypothetical protein
MSFAHSPQIITNGLVLALDAGNTKSYVSGSTTWFDKSGYANNGTLTNGPTFSSTNGGSIVFDGVDDYVDILNSTSSNSSNFTIETYITLNSTGSIFVKPFDSTSSKTINFSFPWATVTNKFSLELFTTGGYPYFRSQQTISTGSSYYVSITCTPGLYGDYRDVYYLVNGTYLVSSQSDFSANGYSAGRDLRYSSFPFNIGRNNAYSTPLLYVNMNMSFLRFYNRALTASEVQQNFNALRGRFGI